MAETLQAFGHEEKISKKILIVGGGNIGFNLAKNLEESLDSVRVKIVEKNKERAEYLANYLKTKKNAPFCQENNFTIAHLQELKNYNGVFCKENNLKKELLRLF